MANSHWQQLIALIDPEWPTAALKLFESPLRERWTHRISEGGENTERPAPHFKEEATPALQPVVNALALPFQQWSANPSSETCQPFASALQFVGVDGILLLLGQRRTPASIADDRAVPPSRELLLESASADFNPFINVAARALAKHAERSEDTFWGVIQGNQKHQNEIAIKRVERLISDATWWNVFEHYAQGLVYEVRVESGHGARWSTPDFQFIGFLDPFLEESA